MTNRLLALLLLLSIAPGLSSVRVLSQSVQPIPRGRAAANDATRKAEQVEPPAPVAHKISAADLQKQVDELVSLSQQVRSGTERASQGLIDKDLKDKLRRIEKLSKKLREELAL